MAGPRTISVDAALVLDAGSGAALEGVVSNGVNIGVVVVDPAGLNCSSKSFVEIPKN